MTYKGGIYMSIKWISNLDDSLKESIKLVRKTSMISEVVSFLGAKTNITTTDSSITIYHLLPNLEGAEIVIRETKTNKECYLIIKNLIATLKEEVVVKLEEQLLLASASLEKEDIYSLDEALVLPEDIWQAKATMEKLSTIDIGEDKLYDEYCRTLKNLRAIQFARMKSFKEEQTRILRK